jgi:tryptophanyl-tRNA synthetase
MAFKRVLSKVELVTNLHETPNGPYATMTSNSHLVEVSKETYSQILRIKEQYGYSDITPGIRIGHLDHHYLSGKFFCHDRLDKFGEVPIEKRAIVAGFGPTNPPTAGTLSVLLKTISLQRETGCYTEIVVSNLGAYLSRNVEWDYIETITKRFLDFICYCGFDLTKGRIRTHIDKENLGISSFLSENIFTMADFDSNREATEELYGTMNLLGPRLGIIVDTTYTVSDIIKPLFNSRLVKEEPHEKERILVIAGIEEHYFVRLARIAIERIGHRFPGQYISENAEVSALYGRLIPGLAPYPKMSKSIPDSSISLGDSQHTIMDKIMQCAEENERVILEMMTQASNWSQERISSAFCAFSNRHKNPLVWKLMKEEYALHFIEISSAWDKATANHPFPATTLSKRQRETASGGS